jgi:hypothetical protein
MQLLTGVEYFGKSKVNGYKQEVLCQTILAGGTADFYIRNQDQSSWSLVVALTDVPQTIRVPINGGYKVELTGSATVYGDWS